MTQFRRSQHLWLELKIKFIIAEILIIGGVQKKKIIKKFPDSRLAKFFQFKLNSATPDLSEVTLATLLKQENISYRLRSYDDLFSKPHLIEKDLKDCSTVFVSATYLKDLSELMPVVEKVKCEHNKVVVGGALTGSLCHAWPGDKNVDVLAIGYGEYLVPALAPWIRGEENLPLSPPKGRLVKKNETYFLYSGVPESLSLDNLISPDWALSERDHQKKYRMVFYESVRGCPYRCAFCNYPYLFDDTKFRTKSAAKMIADWKSYAQMGVEYVTCLDSLFTMPKQRLIEFCQGLIDNEIKLKWVCYARTDDLCDEEVVRLMVASGCIQVQIGIESGDAVVLENMNKRTNPETNARALENCRKYQLTTVVTLISGFPGETKETIDRTIQFLERAPCDFFFVAVFSVRVPGVPILSQENRKKYGLKILDNDYSLSPYWAHQTMNCHEASLEARRMTAEIIKRNLSLDATLFYNEILDYDHNDREELLAFQSRAFRKGAFIKAIFSCILGSIDFFFKRDLKKTLAKVEV
jgi:radical SAM superfamily enzyme YgiQ (UPF0313 family)